MADTFNPHGSTTIDGVLITVGLAVWDYNLRATTVTADRDAEWWAHQNDQCDGNHWFDTANGGMFDAGRMWVRHPTTRQPAADVEPGTQG